MKNKYISEEKSREIIDLVLSDDFDLEQKIRDNDKFIYNGDFRWAFVCADLSDRDLTQVPVKKLLRLPFGNKTVWPSEDKLPKGFAPYAVLEQALTFKGCEIDGAHQKSIMGQGVTIAFIDNPFNLDHKEVVDSNIEYFDFSNGSPNHFHGIVTSSYLVGKNLGVAPKAKLLFYATGSDYDRDRWESLVESELKALKDIILRSENGQKIDILGQSASIDYHISFVKNAKKRQLYLDSYNQLLEELKEQGIFYLNADNFLSMFSYCRKIDPTKENDNLDNYIDHFYGTENYEEGNPSVIPVGKLSPLDDTKNAYKYENLCGSESWSIPLVVGMFALARQIKPSIFFEEFYEIAKNTAKKNINGVPLISSMEICNEIALRREKSIVQ